MKKTIVLLFVLFVSAISALPLKGPWRTVEKAFSLLSKKESTADQFTACFVPEQRKDAAGWFASRRKKTYPKMEIFQETVNEKKCIVHCREKDIPFSETVVCLKKQKNGEWLIDLAETRKQAERTPSAMQSKCRKNLKRLGVLFALYAAENDGKFPESFDQIKLPAVYDSPKKKNRDELSRLFMCPVGKQCYCYRSEPTAEASPAEPVAWCRYHRHPKTGESLTLFSDGHVEFFRTPASGSTEP